MIDAPAAAPATVLVRISSSTSWTRRP